MPGSQLPKVPEGLRDLMKGLTKEILREKPTDLYEFSAQFFEAIVRERKDFRVKEFEPVSEYDFMKNRDERHSFPSALIYSIIPVGLTELIKDFIKAVLKQRPENICVFGVEYFRRLQKIKKNERIDYLTFEKTKEQFSFTPFVKCTCGGYKGIAATYNKNINNNNEGEEFAADEIHKHENCSTNMEITHFNGGVNEKSELTFDERTIKAVYIIQKFCRRYVNKKRASKLGLSIKEKAEQQLYEQNGREINQNEGNLQRLKNLKNESDVDSLKVLSTNHVKENNVVEDLNVKSSLETKFKIPLNSATENGLETVNTKINGYTIGTNANETKSLEEINSKEDSSKTNLTKLGGNLSEIANITAAVKDINSAHDSLNNKSQTLDADLSDKSEIVDESKQLEENLPSNSKLIAEIPTSDTENLGNEQKTETKVSVESNEETPKSNEIVVDSVKNDDENINKVEEEQNEKNRNKNLKKVEGSADGIRLIGDGDSEINGSSAILKNSLEEAALLENGLDKESREIVGRKEIVENLELNKQQSLTENPLLEDTYDKETGEQIVILNSSKNHDINKSLDKQTEQIENETTNKAPYAEVENQGIEAVEENMTKVIEHPVALANTEKSLTSDANSNEEKNSESKIVLSLNNGNDDETLKKTANNLSNEILSEEDDGKTGIVIEKDKLNEPLKEALITDEVNLEPEEVTFSTKVTDDYNASVENSMPKAAKELANEALEGDSNALHNIKTSQEQESIEKASDEKVLTQDNEVELARSKRAVDNENEANEFAQKEAKSLDNVAEITKIDSEYITSEEEIKAQELEKLATMHQQSAEVDKPAKTNEISSENAEGVNNAVNGKDSKEYTNKSDEKEVTEAIVKKLLSTEISMEKDAEKSNNIEAETAVSSIAEEKTQNKGGNKQSKAVGEILDNSRSSNEGEAAKIGKDMSEDKATEKRSDESLLAEKINETEDNTTGLDKGDNEDKAGPEKSDKCKIEVEKSSSEEIKDKNDDLTEHEIKNEEVEDLAGDKISNEDLLEEKTAEAVEKVGEEKITDIEHKVEYKTFAESELKEKTDEPEEDEVVNVQTVALEEKTAIGIDSDKKAEADEKQTGVTKTEETENKAKDFISEENKFEEKTVVVPETVDENNKVEADKKKSEDIVLEANSEHGELSEVKESKTQNEQTRGNIDGNFEKEIFDEETDLFENKGTEKAENQEMFYDHENEKPASASQNNELKAKSLESTEEQVDNSKETEEKVFNSQAKKDIEQIEEELLKEKENISQEEQTDQNDDKSSDGKDEKDKSTDETKSEQKQVKQDNSKDDEDIVEREYPNKYEVDELADIESKQKEDMVDSEKHKELGKQELDSTDENQNIEQIKDEIEMTVETLKAKEIETSQEEQQNNEKQNIESDNIQEEEYKSTNIEETLINQKSSLDAVKEASEIMLDDEKPKSLENSLKEDPKNDEDKKKQDEKQDEENKDPTTPTGVDVSKKNLQKQQNNAAKTELSSTEENNETVSTTNREDNKDEEHANGENEKDIEEQANKNFIEQNNLKNLKSNSTVDDNNVDTEKALQQKSFIDSENKVSSENGNGAANNQTENLENYDEMVNITTDEAAIQPATSMGIQEFLDNERRTSDGSVFKVEIANEDKTDEEKDENLKAVLKTEQLAEKVSTDLSEDIETAELLTKTTALSQSPDTSFKRENDNSGDISTNSKRSEHLTSAGNAIDNINTAEAVNEQDKTDEEALTPNAQLERSNKDNGENKSQKENFNATLTSSADEFKNSSVPESTELNIEELQSSSDQKVEDSKHNITPKASVVSEGSNDNKEVDDKPDGETKKLEMEDISKVETTKEVPTPLIQKTVIGKQTAPKLTNSKQTVSKSEAKELKQSVPFENAELRNKDSSKLITKTDDSKAKSKNLTKTDSQKLSDQQKEKTTTKPNKSDTLNEPEQSTLQEEITNLTETPKDAEANAQPKKTTRICQVEGLKNEYQEQKYIQYPIAEIYLKSFRVPDGDSNQVQNSDIKSPSPKKVYVSSSPSEASKQETETEFSDSLNEENFERDSLEVSSAKDTDIEEDSLEVEHNRKQQEQKKNEVDAVKERMPTYLFGMPTTEVPQAPKEQIQHIKKAIAFVIPFERPNKVVLKDYRTTEDIISDETDKSNDEKNATLADETTDDDVVTVEETRLQTIFEQNEVESPREEIQHDLASTNISKREINQEVEPGTKIKEILPEHSLAAVTLDNVENVLNSTTNSANVLSASNEDKMTAHAVVNEEPTFESNETLSILSDNDSNTESSTFTNSKDFDDAVLSDENFSFRDDLEYASNQRRNQQLAGSADSTPKGGIYEIDPNSLKSVLQTAVDQENNAKSLTDNIENKTESKDLTRSETVEADIHYEKENSRESKKFDKKLADDSENIKLEADKIERSDLDINESNLSESDNQKSEQPESSTKVLFKNIQNSKASSDGIKETADDNVKFNELTKGTLAKEVNYRNKDNQNETITSQRAATDPQNILNNQAQLEPKELQTSTGITKTEVQNKNNNDYAGSKAESIADDKKAIVDDIAQETESLKKVLKDVKQSENVTSEQEDNKLDDSTNLNKRKVKSIDDIEKKVQDSSGSEVATKESKIFEESSVVHNKHEEENGDITVEMTNINKQNFSANQASNKINELEKQKVEELPLKNEENNKLDDSLNLNDQKIKSIADIKNKSVHSNELEVATTEPIIFEESSIVYNKHDKENSDIKVEEANINKESFSPNQASYKINELEKQMVKEPPKDKEDNKLDEASMKVALTQPDDPILKLQSKQELNINELPKKEEIVDKITKESLNNTSAQDSLAKTKARGELDLLENFVDETNGVNDSKHDSERNKRETKNKDKITGNIQSDVVIFTADEQDKMKDKSRNEIEDNKTKQLDVNEIEVSDILNNESNKNKPNDVLRAHEEEIAELEGNLETQSSKIYEDVENGNSENLQKAELQQNLLIKDDVDMVSNAVKTIEDDIETQLLKSAKNVIDESTETKETGLDNTHKVIEIGSDNMQKDIEEKVGDITKEIKVETESLTQLLENAKNVIDESTKTMETGLDNTHKDIEIGSDDMQKDIKENFGDLTEEIEVETESLTQLLKNAKNVIDESTEIRETDLDNLQKDIEEKVEDITEPIDGKGKSSLKQADAIINDMTKVVAGSLTQVIKKYKHIENEGDNNSGTKMAIDEGECEHKPEATEDFIDDLTKDTEELRKVLNSEGANAENLLDEIKKDADKLKEVFDNESGEREHMNSLELNETSNKNAATVEKNQQDNVEKDVKKVKKDAIGERDSKITEQFLDGIKMDTDKPLKLLSTEKRNETINFEPISDEKQSKESNKSAASVKGCLEESAESISGHKTKENKSSTKAKVIVESELPKESISLTDEEKTEALGTNNSINVSEEPLLKTIKAYMATAKDSKALIDAAKTKEDLQYENADQFEVTNPNFTEIKLNEEAHEFNELAKELENELKDSSDMESLDLTDELTLSSGSRQSDTSNSELITIVEKLQEAPSPPQHSPNSDLDIEKMEVLSKTTEISEKQPILNESETETIAAEKVNWFVGEEPIVSEKIAPQLNSLDLINTLDQHQDENSVIKQAPQVNSVNIGFETNDEVANIKQIEQNKNSNELSNEEKLVSAEKSQHSNEQGVLRNRTSSLEEYIKAIQGSAEGAVENENPNETATNIKDVEDMIEKKSVSKNASQAETKTISPQASVENKIESNNASNAESNLEENLTKPGEEFKEKGRTIIDIKKVTESFMNAQKQFWGVRENNKNKETEESSNTEMKTQEENPIIITQTFLQSEIVYNSNIIYEEVVEEVCIKKSVSQTTINEIENEAEIETEIKENSVNSSKEASLSDAEQNILKSEELVLKMQKRRSLELDAAPHIKEKSFEQASFDDPVIKTMESIVSSRNSTAEDSDEVVIMKTITPQASFDYDPKATFKRLHTIAVDDPKVLFKSVTIDETVKYIELSTDSEATPTGTGSLCLDEDTSENIRKKMMAYSLSEADSDLYEPKGVSFDVPRDDFDINTAFEETETTSTETESTIVSAATKIQAGARGFLTRRRLRHRDTKSQINDGTRDSFGNNAISESLETMVENAAAKKIQKAYRSHRQNVGKTVKRSPRYISHENSLAAKRMTLQRGDALRNNSSPEEEENNTEHVEVAEAVELVAAEPKEVQSAMTIAPQNAKAASTSKSNELKWLGMRQNSMPVQIDCEVFRVIPKHMRKRITSAEGAKKPKRRVQYD